MQGQHTLTSANNCCNFLLLLLSLCCPAKTAHAKPSTVCKSDESGITCIWSEVAPGETKLVTITTNATTGGLQPSIAAVTTSSLDTDATNNRASVEVSVLVSPLLTR